MTKILLDKITFNQKPQGYEVGEINNRISKIVVDVTPLELADAISNGSTFVGATLKEVNGELLRRKENWQSQTVVALDFDEGLTIEEALNDEFFNQYAAFMYLTFSHTPTNHKFRVVFVLETAITNYYAFEKLITQLLNKYPQADKACKDGIRLYFGGTDYYEFNFENKLPINFDTPKKGFWEDREYLSYMSSQKPLKALATSVSKEQQSKAVSNKHVEFIKQHDVENLRIVLNAPKIKFSNYDEAVDYIKKFELHTFLDLRLGNFHDVFHDDNNPSASIFVSSSGSNHYLYKCHSNNHKFSGTIVEVVKELMECNSDEAIEFIFNVLNVTIEYSKEMLIKLTILENNLDLIDSESMQDEYPSLARLVNQFGISLGTLLTFAKRKLRVHESKIITYPSLGKLAKLARVGKNTISNHLNLFTLLGLINKNNYESLPYQIQTTLKSYQDLHSYKYSTNVFEIPEYDAILLQKAEVIAEKWISNGCTTKTINYEGIQRTFGQQVANNVFPQDKDKEISSLNTIVADKLERHLCELIDKYGYTTESLVLKETKLFFVGQKQLKESELKRCISELIDKYGLIRVSMNKTLKEELGYNGNGYPKILLKEDLYLKLVTTK